jgi:hypothetical protein
MDICCFSSKQIAWRTSCLRNRIICLSEVTCLPTDCCFKQLAQEDPSRYVGQVQSRHLIICWSSTKQTSYHLLVKYKADILSPVGQVQSRHLIICSSSTKQTPYHLLVKYKADILSSVGQVQSRHLIICWSSTKQTSYHLIQM